MKGALFHTNNKRQSVLARLFTCIGAASSRTRAPLLWSVRFSWFYSGSRAALLMRNEATFPSAAPPSNPSKEELPSICLRSRPHSHAATAHLLGTKQSFGDYIVSSRHFLSYVSWPFPSDSRPVMRKRLFLTPTKSISRGDQSERESIGWFI